MSETPDNLVIEDAPVDGPEEDVPYDVALLEELVAQTARAADAAEWIAVALENLASSRKMPPSQSRIHVPPPARRSP